MRTEHRTFAKTVLVICVMLSMALSSLPESAEAMGGVFEQVHLHDHSDAYPGHTEDENAAEDRRCHPGLDCQIVSVFLNNPRFKIQVAELGHRFFLTRSDIQGVTIPFDVPPPRNGS